MLDANVNIHEIHFNSNNSFVDNISNFNIYDSDVPVSIKSLVENYNNNNINIIHMSIYFSCLVGNSIFDKYYFLHFFESIARNIKITIWDPRSK